jgi:hypothetical protein
MNTIQKRFLLFLLGCIPTRLAFVYLAKNISLKYLPLLGYLALFPAIGFVYLFVSGARSSGPETFGDKIWWNNLRPIHALFYFWFAYYAIKGIKEAWTPLFYDVVLGLFSFLIYHFSNGDFSKLIS